MRRVCGTGFIAEAPRLRHLTAALGLERARSGCSFIGIMSELTIEAGRTERQYWRDLWKYRELFYFLAWRDLLVRYKQTIVGVAWSVVRPFMSVVVLTLVFSVFAQLPSGGVPYPLMVFCGNLPWTFFSTAITESGQSLVNNGNLVSKIYFPRLILPASSVIVSLVDFLVSAAMLSILLGWYHFMPPAQIVFAPLFIVLLMVLSFGAGMWISALMVEYRDFRFIVPFVMQLGFWVTPVAYLFTDRLAEKYRLLYSLNPMVGVIDGFRWCVLGGEHHLFMPALGISLAWAVFLIFSGVAYFRRVERTFADVI
jgi:lipopolysaccharide transport system permease protein